MSVIHVLFAISILALIALLWACIGVTRHILKARQDQPPADSSDSRINDRT